MACTFTHHARTPADRISDETVTVTFREIAPGRAEVTLVDSRTGPSYYETLRKGWDEWLDLLRKNL